IEWPKNHDEPNGLRQTECPMRPNEQSNYALPNENTPKIRNIEKIQFGQHLIDTWYFSPYPNEYSQCRIIYICEFCLCHFSCEKQLRRHAKKCTIRHPPGNEIYRDDNVSFFEIDGRRQLKYCRNLALLSKLFLDHKDLKYDIDEKNCETNYNLSCILTLPQHQRKGYGRLLISFSYELSKIEGQIGTPERPLSDLGLTSYYSYWQEAILDICMEAAQNKRELSIEEISVRTSIDTDDVISTLHFLNAFREYKRHIAIVLDHRLIALYKEIKARKKLTIAENRFDPRYKKNVLIVGFAEEN
ncbi:4531_t:CDS:2, partial [Acaulospora morrowiae]